MDETKEPNCRVFIKRNADGAVRSYEDNFNFIPDENGFSDEYIWREGNWACDCNRAIFFYRVDNKDGDEDWPCGDNAYSVWIEGLDGQRLYED